MGAEAATGKSAIPAEEAAKTLKGFEIVRTLPGSTFQDQSTVIVCPTRGMIHHRVVSSFQNMIAPMNQRRAFLFAAGHEVGRAYDAMIDYILGHPQLSKYRYLMTVEDDQIITPDAHIRLLESIEVGFKADAASGLYFTKSDFAMPMAYGDPEVFRSSGQLTFEPLDIREIMRRGQLVEVNGIAMGCALWRMDLFRQLPKPWFVTVADVIPETGPTVATQDLYFCANARRAGKRFVVDTRVCVGHLNVETGEVY